MEQKRHWKLFVGAVAAVLISGGIFTTKLLKENEEMKSSTEKSPIELSFFLRKRETIHIFEKIVEEFNHSQSEIVVRTVVTPNPDVELEMRAINGDFPDIVEMIGSQKENLFQYGKGGYLVPLNDAEFWDRVMAGYEEPLMADGNIYMVPLTINFRGIFLNLDKMEQGGYEMPNSYEAMITMLEDIQVNGELPMIFPDKDVWTIHQGWDAIYTAENGSQEEIYWMAAKGIEPLWKNEELKESLEKYLDLRRFGQTASWETSYDEALSRFAKGEAYVFLQGNWAYSAIKKQNPDIRIAFIPFPSEEEKDPNIVVKLDASIGISSSCKYLQQAYTFLNYLLSEEVMQYYTENTGSYSCIKGGNGDISFAKRFVDKIEKKEFIFETVSIPESGRNVRDQGLFQLVISQYDDRMIQDFLMEFNEAIEMRKDEILESIDRGNMK